MKMFSSVTKALIHSLNNNGELVDLFNPSEEDKQFLTILANNEDECDEKQVRGTLEQTVEVTVAGTMTFVEVTVAGTMTFKGDLVRGNKWKIRYFVTASSR